MGSSSEGWHPETSETIRHQCSNMFAIFCRNTSFFILLLSCLVCLVASLREATRCPRDLARVTNDKLHIASHLCIAYVYTHTLCIYIMSLMAHDCASILHFVKVEGPNLFSFPARAAFKAMPPMSIAVADGSLYHCIRHSRTAPICSPSGLPHDQTMQRGHGLMWEQIAKVPVHVNPMLAPSSPSLQVFLLQCASRGSAKRSSSLCQKISLCKAT